MDFTGIFTRPVDPYAPPAGIGCDETEKPGVLAFRAWVLDNLGGQSQPRHIVRPCSIGGPSKHHEGRAWDWFFADAQAAEAFLSCLTSPDEDGEPDALARRAGLRVIIYNRRMWVAGKGWGPYTKVGGSPHTDHVHFGFGWPGALGQTSLFDVLEDGEVVTTSDVAIADVPTVELVELLDVPGLRHETSRAFKRKAIRLARQLEIDPSYWLAVMSFESAGTFAPDIRNPDSGAVGLIQFTKEWAPKVVGKTVDQLAAMTALEQLDYVAKWYKKAAGIGTLQAPRDYYLAVFAPSGIGQGPGFPLYKAPSKQYEQNAKMDTDGDGVITVGDVTAKFDGYIQDAEKRPPVIVDMRQHRGAAIAGALATILGTAAIVSRA